MHAVPGPLAGIRCLERALRLLRTRRELWPLAAAPLVMSFLAFGLAIGVFVAAYDAWMAALQAWFAVPTPDAWYGWLWAAPLRAVAWLARWVLVAAFAVVVYLSFTLVGGVLASPFLDALSRRVERLQTARVVELDEAGLAVGVRAALRVAGQEAKRALFFLTVQAALLLLGLLPGAQLLTIPLAFAFAALFLPLDYTGYLLDRRGVSFDARRRWVWRHRMPVGVFGATALGTFAVPGLNLLALPWLVTAATLLALEIGAPAPADAPRIYSPPSALRR